MSNPYESPGAPAGGPDPEVVKQISSKATTSLVSGLLGIFCCAIVGIYAITTANEAQNMIEQTGVGQEHSGKATAGKVLGIIALVLWGLSIIFNVVVNMGGGGG